MSEARSGVAGPDIEPRSDFLAEVEKATGESLSACFQCRKCASGCPLAGELDLFPNQVLRLVQLGRRDEVLGSKAIWLCLSCETCTERCPNGVDLAKVQDYLRFAAIVDGIAPAEPNVARFHEAFLETVRKYGRSHEIDMIRRYKMKSGKWLDNMAVGFDMFRKGKIRIAGERIQGVGEVREIMDRGAGGRGKA